MMNYEFELRLIGADAPDGEVRLADLAALAQGFQDLSLRVGRELAMRSGPGRTDRTVEALTEMRLSGLGGGSTELRFTRGQRDQLDLELVEAAEVDEKFWEVIDGVATNSRPVWVTDLIAEGAAKVVAALQASAREVEFNRPGVDSKRLTTRTLRGEVWAARAASASGELTIVGMLEAVDLHNHRFRVRDDVGNGIPLLNVPNDTEGSHLIGRRVRVVGIRELRADGRLKAIWPSSLEEESLPPSWSAGSFGEWRAELSKPGPVFDGGVELDDDEYAALIGIVRG